MSNTINNVFYCGLILVNKIKDLPSEVSFYYYGRLDLYLLHKNVMHI